MKETRKLAVIETPIGISTKFTQQLMLVSAKEFNKLKREFPYLVVRWAENQDKAGWRLADQLFDEDKTCRTS